MKRQKLMHHLRQHGCIVLREGKRHTIVLNPLNDRQTAVERHREINARTTKGICKQLGVSAPQER
jgi:hypothetical protein